MSTQCILLIQGNEDSRARLTQTLQGCGWTILQTTSAAVGMDTAKRRAPDLILLDVTSQKIDADRMARLFKSDPITCAIPIISLCETERAQGLREPWAVDTATTTTALPILLAKLKNAMRQRVRKPYILIVDDEPDLVDYLGTTLGHQGYVVSGASNGMEALEVIRSVHPDVIVLDLDMPLLNGWDFLHQVRAGPGLAHTKVIILTGVDQSLEDRQHGLKLGACNYLLKPCDPEELARAIEAALKPSDDDEEN
jgi:DNA-binding response OmpR family regulator